MAAVCVQRNFPSSQRNGLKPDLELSDSGLTLTWLLDVLWKNCNEFRAAVGKGSVHEVRSAAFKAREGDAEMARTCVVTFPSRTNGDNGVFAMNLEGRIF